MVVISGNLQVIFNNLIGAKTNIEGENLPIEFIFDGYQQCVRYLFKSCPYGKVAIITDKQNIHLSVTIYDLLKENGFIPFNCIVEEEISVDRLGVLFALPEDIRQVIAVGNGCGSYSQYFSKIKNIPLMFIPTQLSLDKTLYSILKIKNGDNFDSVCCLTPITVLVDSSIIVATQQQCACELAKVICNVIHLLDYQISCYLNGIVPNCNCQTVILNTLLSISNLKQDTSTQIIFLHSLASRYADILSGGKLINNSSITAYYNLCKDKGVKYLDSQLLNLAKKILLLYKTCLTQPIQSFNLCDYNKRVDYISKTKSEVVMNLENILKGVRVCRNKLQGVNDFSQKFSSKINNASQIFFYLNDKIKKHNEVAVGQTDNNHMQNIPLNTKIIAHLGDLAFNGMTVVREMGFLEGLN